MIGMRESGASRGLRAAAAARKSASVGPLPASNDVGPPENEDGSEPNCSGFGVRPSLLPSSSESGGTPIVSPKVNEDGSAARRLDAANRAESESKNGLMRKGATTSTTAASDGCFNVDPAGPFCG